MAGAEPIEGLAPAPVVAGKLLYYKDLIRQGLLLSQVVKRQAPINRFSRADSLISRMCSCIISSV
jgi:hypothetical protein